MYPLALFTGLFSSLHCIGMCGPLVMGLPSYESGWRLIWNKVSYNLGRICTYSLLGLILGFIGKRLWVPQLQESLSLGIGVVVLLWASFRLTATFPLPRVWENLILMPIQNGIQYVIKHRAGTFWIGVVNGALPCGMVYLALAGALNTLSPLNALLYMMWFGLGTIPLMLSFSLGIGWVGSQLRSRLRKISSYFILFMGIWFILRGLHLGIPYLSASVIHWGISLCH
jgi:uncharacterized protein